MLKYSLILLAVLSTACGAPPEADEDAEQKLQPPPVTLGAHWLCSYIGSGAGFTHSIHQYSDGSIFTSCEIDDNYDTTSSLSLFRADQPGAATASCLVTYDWDAPSAGWWKFTFNGTSSKATYSDSGSTYNGMVQNLACTKY